MFPLGGPREVLTAVALVLVGAGRAVVHAGVHGGLLVRGKKKKRHCASFLYINYTRSYLTDQICM
ncbi:MAG TPA: hypothetical protein DEP63_02055 [Candidatus Magasanikbacteria bacterium]|nr:hypothetical protein [Candidatus Magasanikbacteria bacterium]HCC13507.1 hypothetical protein [Candidatus Magasanikbacteria bacterium]